MVFIYIVQTILIVVIDSVISTIAFIGAVIYNIQIIINIAWDNEEITHMIVIIKLEEKTITFI